MTDTLNQILSNPVLNSPSWPSSSTALPGSIPTPWLRSAASAVDTSSARGPSSCCLVTGTTSCSHAAKRGFAGSYLRLATSRRANTCAKYLTATTIKRGDAISTMATPNGEHPTPADHTFMVPSSSRRSISSPAVLPNATVAEYRQLDPVDLFVIGQGCLRGRWALVSRAFASSRDFQEYRRTIKCDVPRHVIRVARQCNGDYLADWVRHVSPSAVSEPLRKNTARRP